MTRKRPSEYDAGLFELYDRYVHGGIAPGVPRWRGTLRGRSDEVPRIRASLLLHFAENDPNVNAGWPAYEAALKANDVRYEAHVYPGTNHGFQNDTTPRYDHTAAQLAWERTLAHFDRMLRA